MSLHDAALRFRETSAALCLADDAVDRARRAFEDARDQQGQARNAMADAKDALMAAAAAPPAAPQTVDASCASDDCSHHVKPAGPPSLNRRTLLVYLLNLANQTDGAQVWRALFAELLRKTPSA